MKMVDGLIIAAGGPVAALVSGLCEVDLTKGRGVLDDTGCKHCLWTKQGHRITVAVSSDGGVIVSKSKEVDKTVEN